MSYHCAFTWFKVDIFSVPFRCRRQHAVRALQLCQLLPSGDDTVMMKLNSNQHTVHLILHNAISYDLCMLNNSECHFARDWLFIVFTQTEISSWTCKFCQSIPGFTYIGEVYDDISELRGFVGYLEARVVFACCIRCVVCRIS